MLYRLHKLSLSKCLQNKQFDCTNLYFYLELFSIHKLNAVILDELNSSSASHEILHILCKQKLHYSVHNSHLSLYYQNILKYCHLSERSTFITIQYKKCNDLTAQCKKTNH